MVPRPLVVGGMRSSNLIWCINVYSDKDSSLLECDAVSLGEWLQMLWRPYDPSKYQEQFFQWHSGTSQKPGIFTNTTVRASNVIYMLMLNKLLQIFENPMKAQKPSRPKWIFLVCGLLPNAGLAGPGHDKTCCKPDIGMLPGWNPTLCELRGAVSGHQAAWMLYHSDHRGTGAFCCAHCSRAECSVPCDSSCMNTDKQNTVTALASQCAKQKILCRVWKKRFVMSVYK